ncbi:MAG: alpha-ribazole phosphatase [Deltaproteobacteria bacterium]|nr:alpha-ribazole phosphatase [Deltaproteobacteria bacterium]
MSESVFNFPNCEFWLVRHAETAWNKAGRWQGHADVPLSERGRGQVEKLAESWRHEESLEGAGPLFSSDLSRTVETATALGDVLGLQPQLDAGLRELDVGEWSGHVRAEIQQRDPELLARFESEDPDARPPGGETRREIRSRAHRVILALAESYPDSRMVVVTHRGFIRALLPGVDMGNAECVRVSAEEALTRRWERVVGSGAERGRPL